MVEKDLR